MRKRYLEAFDAWSKEMVPAFVDMVSQGKRGSPLRAQQWLPLRFAYLSGQYDDVQQAQVNHALSLSAAERSPLGDERRQLFLHVVADYKRRRAQGFLVFLGLLRRGKIVVDRDVYADVSRYCRDQTQHNPTLDVVSVMARVFKTTSEPWPDFEVK